MIAAPVTAMARTAQAVQDRDLSARAPGGNRGDELGAMARNLNAMLERLGALVTAQRCFNADAAHDLQRERGAAEYREALERMRGDLAGLSALAEVLTLPLRTAEDLARQRGRSLRVELPPDLWVRADPALLAHATLNLLYNALIHGGDTRFQARQVGGASNCWCRTTGRACPTACAGRSSRASRGGRAAGAPAWAWRLPARWRASTAAP